MCHSAQLSGYFRKAAQANGEGTRLEIKHSQLWVAMWQETSHFTSVSPHLPFSPPLCLNSFCSEGLSLLLYVCTVPGKEAVLMLCAANKNFSRQEKRKKIKMIPHSVWLLCALDHSLRSVSLMSSFVSTVHFSCYLRALHTTTEKIYFSNSRKISSLSGVWK